MSLAYTGGENFFLKNLTMYSGIQLTEVITSTFQMKSQVKRNAASEIKKKVLKISTLKASAKIILKMPSV